MSIRNVYTGTYKRIDGSVLSGPALADLVTVMDPELNRELLDRLNSTAATMAAMVARADSIEAYDKMISEGNTIGNQVVQNAIDSLLSQTRSIERVIAALDLGAVALESSDSLDNPNAVFQ